MVPPNHPFLGWIPAGTIQLVPWNHGNLHPQESATKLKSELVRWRLLWTVPWHRSGDDENGPKVAIFIGEMAWNCMIFWCSNGGYLGNLFRKTFYCLLGSLSKSKMVISHWSLGWHSEWDWGKSCPASKYLTFLLNICGYSGFAIISGDGVHGVCPRVTKASSPLGRRS